MTFLEAPRRLLAALAAMAVILVVSCAVSTGAAGAGTAPDPLTDPRPPGMFLEAWSLTPTGVDPTEPGSRAFLAYTLDRGASATDSVTLWNYSDVTLTFHVYATDAINNQDGEFALLPGGVSPESAGSWVTLATNYVTVAPQTRAEIPMTVVVPRDATPGDHAAGVVASVPTPTAGPDGSTAIVDRRTGTRIYVRVPGTVSPELVIDQLTVGYTGSWNPLEGKVTVEYSVRNLGNTRMSARQLVRATDVTGRTVATVRGKRLQDVLPGAVVRQRVVLDGVPALFRAGAVVDLHPEAPPGGTSDDVPATRSYSAQTWAVPWSFLAVLLVGVLVWRIARRIRRRPGFPRPRSSRGPVSEPAARPRPTPERVG